MPKETSIPLNSFDQKKLLLQGVALLFVVLIISFFCFKYMTFVTYPHPSSRIPEYSGSLLIIPFFLFMIGYSILYLFDNQVHHFELHPDLLIITNKTAFSKKRRFFYLEKISAISIQKEFRNAGEESYMPEYEVIILSIQSLDQEVVKYAFFPNFHELKGLKELLKELI